MTTTLSAVERTELKWSRRGQNLIAQYFRWISLRMPWAWRIRLDMAILLNVLLGALVWVIVARLPSDYTSSISSVVGFIYLGVSLPVIALAFFWAYTVTKSVRARSAPKLGGEPGILTSMAVCACFSAWLLIATAAPYVVVSRDKGTGAYQDYYTAVEAAAAAEPVDANASAEAREQAAADQAQAELRRQELARLNRRTASLSGAVFGRDVHSFWYGGHYGDYTLGRTALDEFIAETPRWRDDSDLRTLQSYNTSAYAYPGLITDFERSERYADAVLAHYLKNAGVASETYATIRDSIVAEMTGKLASYAQDAEYFDRTLEDYLYNYLLSYLRDYRSDTLVELQRLETLINASRQPDDVAGAVEYRNAWRTYRQILADPELNEAFQLNPEFERYVSARLTSELEAGHYQQRIRSEPGYRDLLRKLEGGGDPSRDMPEQELRYDLSSSGWSTGAVVALIAALLLAIFVTSLNRVGLAATLGGAGVGALMAGLFGGFGLFNTALISMQSDQFLFRYYWSLTALFALFIPLLPAVRDALTGVRRRWTRALALGAAWGSVGWVLVLVTIWIMPVIKFAPNALALSALMWILWMAGFAIFAKLVFALVARISSYPQPG